MLEQITWGQYLTAIGILTGMYYGVVGLRNYRKELKGLFNKNKLGQGLADEAEDSPDQQHGEGGFDELEQLVNDIRSGILLKAGNEANKEALLEEISARVANFSGLHKPAYQYALTNFIIQHSMAICGVGFSEEELAAVWESLPR